MPIRQVQNRTGTVSSRSNDAKEQKPFTFHTPADQELNGEGQISSAVESESCDSEMMQPERTSQTKETGNQCVVTLFFNKIQPNENTLPSRVLLAIKKHKLTEEINN